MARLRTNRARQTWSLPTMLFAIAIAAALAGCATAPSGGTPREVTGGTSQAQAYVQPLPPPPPTSRWSPQEVVTGFLHANATYAYDPAAARQYLVPGLRGSWHPRLVTVLGALSFPSNSSYPGKLAQLTQTDTQQATITLTVQRLAALSPTGQYFYQPDQAVYQFVLADVDGVWLIQKLPPGPPALLLTQFDFEEVYQPRNLFFFATAAPGVVTGDELVPDPAYAPQLSSSNALNANLATDLVQGLINGPGSWLSRAAWTAFPAGTKLLRPVTISGQTAYVDLGGGAVSAKGVAIQEMEYQIQWTLRNAAYSPAVAATVHLTINGRPQCPCGNPDLVSGVNGGPFVPLVVQTGPSRVAVMQNQASKPAPWWGHAAFGGAVITATAIYDSKPPILAVAVRQGQGCTLYLGTSYQNPHAYQLSASGGSCTSLSWDGDGNLWAVAGSHIWVLPEQNRTPLPVSTPPQLSPNGQRGTRIVSLKMAPDGIRAAMLIRTPDGNAKVILAAVSFSYQGGDGPISGASFGSPVAIGNGLPGPSSISWYDDFDLVAVAGGGIYDVPLTGAAGQLLTTPPAVPESVSTDGNELVIGTSRNSIYVSPASSIAWKSIMKGSNPTYPG